MNDHPVSSVFNEYEPLECEVCRKDLLEEGQGVVAFVEPLSPGSPSGTKRRVVAAYAACKGKCDKAVSAYYREIKGCSTSWEDLHDLINPRGFTRWSMSLMNQFHRGEDYSPEAFETLKDITLKASQKVLRAPTDMERDTFRQDQMWRDLGLS